MTEFEKWWNTPENKGYFADEGYYNKSGEAAYCAWKAALEWVLSYYDKENKDSIEDYHFAESGAWLLIDKELKELNNE